MTGKSASPSSGEQLVVFGSGDLLCAVEVAHVQEINKDVEITPVYLVPGYISGVINLRGQIVTVMHLSTRLGLDQNPGEPNHKRDRIVILRWNEEIIGLQVDYVSDIFTPEKDDLLPVPQNIPSRMRDYFKSVCQTEDNLISILDIEALLEDRNGK